jgi:hypothetical protein
MNKPLDAKTVQAAYVAKFGPMPDDSEGGRYFGSPPLKYAANNGLVQEYLQALQQAVDSGKPFNFADFVRQYSEVSAAN